MEPLKPDTSYHIFNHANGFENIFKENENFRYFLEKYSLYISPIAETYAYCLLPNHFHLVVRMRKREVIEEVIRNRNNLSSSNKFSKVPNFGKVESGKVGDNRKIYSNVEIEKFLSKQFANLFSCYTQSFNKRFKRMGSLFIKNFKSEVIHDKEYFLNAIAYTHRNPVHHGFCAAYTDWGYSSYNEVIEQRSRIVETAKLTRIFGSLPTFVEFHQKYLTKLNQQIELETD